MPNQPYHTEKRRRVLLDGLRLSELTGVEIGPLDDPIVRKTDGRITYVDHATRDHLVAKYRNTPAVDTARIVNVDVVWGGQPLADLIGTGVADYVIASHVAEHVPDLVGWLIDLQRVLKPGGQLLLIMPDKRMSYDAPRRETTLIDVLDPFVRKAKVPQVYQLLDCALGIVTTDAYQMHVNDVRADTFAPIHTIDSALDLARNALATGDYVDVHCWAFTPRSFADLLHELNRHDLLRYACSGVVETDAASNWEFGIKLRAGGSKEAALNSWREARDGALPHIQGSAAAARHARQPAPAPTITPDARPFRLRPYPQLGERHLAHARVVPDRTAYLPHLPKGGVICEIGVALGGFSRSMIETCRPDHFIAVDTFVLHLQDSLWGRSPRDLMGSLTHEEFYRRELGALGHQPTLTVLQGNSDDQVRTLADRSVDIFYVDANHTYEACVSDLDAVKTKVKGDGIIIMNDYVIYDFYGDGTPYGVVQATHEFMVREGWEMIFLALQESMYCDVVLRKLQP